MKSFFQSLRFRLLVLIFLTFLPAMGIILYNGARERAEARAQAIRLTLQTTTHIADEFRTLTANTKQLLAALATLPELRPERDGDCGKLLNRLLRLNPAYANFGVADTDGNVFCSALPLSAPVNIADRLYFQRALSRRDFASGEFQIGRITGKPGLNFGYPLVGDDQVREVVFAALDINEFVQTLDINQVAEGAHAALPPDSVVMLVDHLGKILARVPDGEGWIGKSAAENEIVRQAIATNTWGTAEARDEDGVRRIYSYLPLRVNDQVSAYLILGIPASEAFATVEQRLRFEVILLAVVAIFTMLVGWVGGEVLLTRPIHALLHATQKMKHGELNVRTGITTGTDELSLLGRAFDEMAENLQQQTQARLESEKRLRTVLDNVPIALFALDREGRFILAEGKGLQASGLRTEDLVGRSVFDLFPALSETITKILQRALNGEEVTSVVSLPGATFEVHLMPGRDEQGNIRGVIGAALDISQRAQAEAQMRVQSAALEEGADAVAITDRQGIIQWVNPAFTALTGYTLEECRGQTMRILKSGQHDGEFYQQMWATLLAGNSWRGEIINRRKDGTFYNADQTITPVRISNGEITHFVSIQRDISAQKRHQREAEAEAMIAQAIGESLELRPLLERLLAAAVHAISAAEKGSILLTEADGSLRIRAVYGYHDPRVLEASFPHPDGYSSRAFRQQKPLLLADVQSDPSIRYRGEIEEIAQVQSAIVAPLMVHSRAIGVISLENSTRQNAFDEDDLRLLISLASTAALVIENTRLFEETNERLARLEALREIDIAITGSFDPRVALNVLLDQVTRRLKVDAAAVLLNNPQLQELNFAAGRGFRSRAIERSRLKLGIGHAGQAALERHIIYITDLKKQLDHFVRADLLAGEEFVAYFAVPMIAKGHVLGVLEIYHRSPLEPSPEWLAFLEALAGQAAIAIDSAQLFTNLERSNMELHLAYDRTIEGWSYALDLRDKETEGHTQRVTELTIQLARAMGISEEEIVHIRRGALLHDIGKMGVPDAILLKPDKLTDEEWQIMRRHPQFAYEMLYSIEYLHPALDIPYCHHEKWDGSGYPRGLRGVEIPLPARIFSVVDVWDALISDRPYRAGWSKEQALEYIRQQAGKHFDPRVVEIFLALMGYSQD